MLLYSTNNYFQEIRTANTKYVYLNCKSNEILPFQIFYENGEIQNVSFYLKNWAGEEEITLLYDIFELPQGFALSVYGIDEENPNICGVFQLKITINSDIFYTNFINFIPSSQITWKLEYWNSKNDLQHVYTLGFKHRLYGVSELVLDKPYYKEDIIEKANGQKFYNMQVLGDTYKPTIFGERETMKEISMLSIFDKFSLIYDSNILQLFEKPIIEISKEETLLTYSSTISMIVEKITKTITDENPDVIPHYLINQENIPLANQNDEKISYN